MTPPHRVLCVGHCTLDTIGVVDRLQPPGSKVELHQFTIQGGGAAATACVTLARLGVNTCFVGKVGDDERGALIQRTLSEEGVDTSAMVVEPGAVSQFSFIVAERDSRRRDSFWTRGDVSALTPQEVPLALLDGAHILLVDGYHPNAQLALAREARRRGVRVVYDAGLNHPQAEALVALTDVLVASERFASEFSGVGQLQAALGRLRAAGPSTCVITLGDEGSIGADGEGLHIQEPMSIDDEIDNTGAGDVYRGGLVYALLQGRPLEDAMAFATAAATLSLRGLGGRSALPTLDEIERLLRGTASE